MLGKFLFQNTNLASSKRLGNFVPFVEIALVVFSSDGKAFSCSHPFDIVMDRPASLENSDSDAIHHQAEHKARLHELNNNILMFKHS